MSTDDDYPTDAQLSALTHHSMFGADGKLSVAKVFNWLELARDTYNAEYGQVTVDGSRYTFVTGGWSGNEDILHAMMENMPGWHACWESTHRGGRYVFSLRDA